MKEYRDRNGRLIEEGDIMRVAMSGYEISLVYWDWCREGLGILPLMTTEKEPRSEYIDSVAIGDEVCGEIIAKYDSGVGVMANRFFVPATFRSSGVSVPKMTREQAEELGNYAEYFYLGKFHNSGAAKAKELSLIQKIQQKKKEDNKELLKTLLALESEGQEE